MTSPIINSKEKNSKSGYSSGALPRPAWTCIYVFTACRVCNRRYFNAPFKRRGFLLFSFLLERPFVFFLGSRLLNVATDSKRFSNYLRRRFIVASVNAAANNGGYFNFFFLCTNFRSFRRETAVHVRCINFLYSLLSKYLVNFLSIKRLFVPHSPKVCFSFFPLRVALGLISDVAPNPRTLIWGSQVEFFDSVNCRYFFFNLFLSSLENTSKPTPNEEHRNIK